jgi:adenosylcobyric acid synthase
LTGRGILAKAHGIEVSGYEIHMGQTSGADSLRPFQIRRRSLAPCADFDGFLSEDGNVLGTYMHGLFHNDDFRAAILRELAERKGRTLSAIPTSFSVDEQYDRLAGLVRKNLNMELILRLIDRD